MHKFFKGALALWVGVAGLSVPASANHAWGNYHWARTSNPFTLQLGNNLSGAWTAGYLASSSAWWSESTVLNTMIVAGTARPRTCRATTGRVEVCNAAYGQTGWLGVASISISGDHITAGAVKLNDTYFASGSYNTPAWRNLVMCQEIGHTFGLDHQDETFNNANLGTCMDYTNDPLTNQMPNKHDYDMLATIYAHKDSTTTVGSLTRTLRQPPEIGLSPKSWGRPIKFLRDGRPHRYVRIEGPGQLTLIEVFWVPGMGPKDSHVD